MYKVHETAMQHNFHIEKGCDKCGRFVNFDDKFCWMCGSPLDAPTKDVDNKVCVDDELHEVGKACIAVLAKKYGVHFKDGDSVCITTPSYKSKVVSASRHHFCCGKCGTPIGLYKSFCTECGSQLDVPKDLTTELSWEEVEAIVLAKFYEQNPTLRPVQEQEYRVLIAVHRKWIDSSDFDDEPLSELEMVTSADGVEADIATESLLEDFDKDGALYVSLKDPLNETIDGIFKKWNKEGWFHRRDTFTISCDIGDEHEFLVAVDITKID